MTCSKHIVALIILVLMTSAGPSAAETVNAQANHKNINFKGVGSMLRGPRVKLSHLSRSIGSNIAHKFGKTVKWAGHTRLGYKVKRGRRRLGYGLLVSRGLLTRGADKLEMKLPRKLARGYHHTRQYNPFGLLSFLSSKFRQDPAFLMKYGVFSVAWSYLQPPTLVALGVSLPFAYSLSSSVVIPVDIGVILYRQHKLRKDPEQTIFGTLLGLGGEFNQFNTQRQFDNRVLTYSSSLSHL